jgi:uncharacterized protein
MEKDEFIRIRNSYLTAAAPIRSSEHLKGRERGLASLVNALSSPGRHAFIHGHRGVGKTSLAQTAAFSLPGRADPIIAACERNGSFGQVVSDIIKKALQLNPLETKTARNLNLGASFAGFGGNFGLSGEKAPLEVNIKSISDAVFCFQSCVKFLGRDLVVLIDEFDQLPPTEAASFAHFLKQLSDQNVPVTLILCGIAESVESLFEEHASVFRQVHTEKVERLGLTPRMEIIQDAAGALNIEIESGFSGRIAQISDGWPSFVHLIADKVFTSAYDAGEKRVTKQSYEMGLKEAVSSVELTLKRQYETALHKNQKKYEHVIWAVSADKFLDVNLDMVWSHYIWICNQINVSPVDRNNVTTKLNQMCKSDYGKIILKPRRANYTFSEKMMRAYARLRAESDGGVQLGAENPTP